MPSLPSPVFTAKPTCVKCTTDPSAAVHARTEVAQTYYRRPLPEQLVAFGTNEGRDMFRRALQVSDERGASLLTH